MKEKCILFGRIIIFILCIGIMLGGILFVINEDGSKSKMLQIANPITEVENVDDMKDYLGYEVPVLETKEIAKYIVIGQNHYANHARIIYQDGSEFNMEAGQGDASGIYGGEKIKEASIGGVQVTINKYKGVYYATWMYGDYSFSYSKKTNNVEELSLEVNELLKVIR